MRKALKSRTVRIVIMEWVIRVAFIILVAHLTTMYISEPVKQIIIFVILVTIYAVIDAIVLHKFFKKESEEYLGWRLLWVYPYNQIMIAISIITICVIGLAIYIRTARTISEESIIIGITTGIIASSIIILLSEMSGNYKNNIRRLAVLNDYISTVHFYKDDIDLNRNTVERRFNSGKIQLVDFNELIEKMGDEFESKQLISSYSALDLQAIAWEIADYWQLLIETRNNHSELLYLNEIKSLNNIASCIKRIQAFIIASQRREIMEEEKQLLEEGSISYRFSKNEADLYEVDIESYLRNISKENNEVVLTSLAVVLVYFDQNMKLLNQYVKYLDDKEFKHLKHLTDKVERNITRHG